jgi:hypothetical protein
MTDQTKRAPQGVAVFSAAIANLKARMTDLENELATMRRENQELRRWQQEQQVRTPEPYRAAGNDPRQNPNFQTFDLDVKRRINDVARAEQQHRLATTPVLGGFAPAPSRDIWGADPEHSDDFLRCIGVIPQAPTLRELTPDTTYKILGGQTNGQ